MKKTILFTLLALAGMRAGAAEVLYVAAASDLVHCIDALGAAFEKEAPDTGVKVTVGASGNFFAQIKNGAPYDVFLSADMRYPTRLAMEGAADGATLTMYAVGRLALWTAEPRIDLAAHGMAAFGDARVTRIAIANPDLAPYGMAARATLEFHGLWEQVKPRLVQGENIAQTAQFVQTGNAQLGLVSYATVLAPAMKGVGSHFLPPAASYPPIEQGAIVTKQGKAKPAAARFVQFLRGPAARAILARSGFALPQPHRAVPRND